MVYGVQNLTSLERFLVVLYPGLPPYKKREIIESHIFLVIYENIKVTESAIEAYGNMEVMKKP